MEISCPSDLLKRLLELALSRSAAEIVIEIENGGISELRVRDNGTGIYNIPQYLKHDVFQEIYPYCGLKMTSKAKNADRAYYYHSLFGHLRDYKEVDHAQGTALCINDLFFNLPDKYRKLRKDNEERQQIINITCEFYILYGLAIKLVSNNKVICHMPSVQSLEERISFLPSSYYGKRIAVILHTCGTIHILRLKGIAVNRILEKEYCLSEKWSDHLERLLNFDKALFAIVHLKRNAEEEEIARMMLETEQRLEQWKLNKDRNKISSVKSAHKSIERETLLRAKVIKGACRSDLPAVSMDENELTVTLPNGFTIIIPIRQLGY